MFPRDLYDNQYLLVFSNVIDNVTTLAKVFSQIYNGSSKLRVKHNMVRELITYEVSFVNFVRSQQNLTYHTSKQLVKDLGHNWYIELGLKYM